MNEYFVYPKQGLKSFTVSSIWKFFQGASYGVKSVEIFGYFETQYPKLSSQNLPPAMCTIKDDVLSTKTLNLNFLSGLT